MNDRLPVRLDRGALDRVLKRATELQAHGRDLADELSEDEVLDLGTEVGIPEASLRQALLEERTRDVAPVPDGALDEWIAPGTISVSRVVHGDREEIGTALTKWLDSNEVLSVQRTKPGLVIWEQASSFAAAMRRVGWALNSRKSRLFLDRAKTVTALISPLETGFCHVTLVAEMRPVRAGYIWGGAGVGTALTAGGTAAALLLGAPAVVGAAVLVPAFGVGWLIARLYRPVAERTRLGLARALDHLEQRPAHPVKALQSPRKSFTEDLGSVVREITREVRKAIEEKK